MDIFGPFLINFEIKMGFLYPICFEQPLSCTIQNQLQFKHISCLRFQEFYHMHQEIKNQSRNKKSNTYDQETIKIRHIHN